MFSSTTSIENGADVERLSQKATILARVGWGLVSHLIIGGHKARRYTELANGDFIWCHVQCSWSQLLGQPHHICRPRIRMIRYVRTFPLIIGTLYLSLSLFLGCGDNDGPVGPGNLAKIVAINGLYYKGVMGDTIPDTVLQFTVADKNNNYLPNQQIQLFLVEGDGHLNPKSITTDSSGIAGFPYAFTGDSGHAVIRLIAPDVDTLDILLRANTLIPGLHGQGQYVLFDDTYADVKNFNGDPASVDVDPDYWVVYANFESALGVVVVIEDANQDNSAADWEEVKGVIVNTVYLGTTTDTIPIGIGSSISDVRAIFPDPDTVRYDPIPPPAVYIRYLSKGLTFYGDFTADTNIVEIHLSENIISTAARKNKQGANQIVE